MKSVKVPNQPDNVSSAGVVTLLQWMMMPDGETYLHLFADRWEVITDKMMPIDGFRSAEKWTLAGILNGQAVVLIPGCQVKAYAHCTSCPKAKSVYHVK